MPAIEGEWRILAIDDEMAVHDTYRAIFSEKLEDELEEIEALVGLIGGDEEGAEREISDAERFRLDHAMGGQEGYALFAQAAQEGDPYAVIYLDMRMPAGWDGLQTAEKIREIDPEVRIILITAYMDYSLTEIRERIGVNFDFLAKPVNVNELLQLTLSLATQWSQARELAAALERVEAANRAKDNFLATMSHELRTPLAAIIGNSELLEGGELTEMQRELLETIKRSGHGLLALVNDILDISKIESGNFQIDALDFDLNQLIGELEQTFSQRAEDAGLTLTVRQEAPFPMQFIGDERRIGQILINLMGNAIKFTESGGITLEVWKGESRLHFVVEDSGIGMSQEVLDRLFRPFEQADQSISRRYGGTGLGLHISATLANLMGGSIEVSSRQGKGSRFELLLPCWVSEKPATPREEQRAKANRFTGQVLIAEDTPVLQLLVRRMLEAVGIEVALADNGREAMEQALATPFDLVLMDMQMPEMDGIEATRLIRSVGNETPIVALTANVMPQHREQFEAAGCNGFLSKPIDHEKLTAVLRQYLRAAEPPIHFRGKVLVAQESEALQQQYRELLEPLGIEVTTVGSGNEVVEQGLATPFDLVLMDMQMPVMDGVEATQLMRSVGCESPIVMMSGDAEQHREQLEAVGCSGVLAKPIEKEAVIALLQQYLQEVEPGAQQQQEQAVSNFVDEELMQLFVERTRQQRELILDALNAEDWKEVRVIAHTVKGSGATFGYPEITRLGKEICDGLDNNQPEPVPALVQELIAEMEKI
jgi:signal transduction histidine kinase/AmiR/NasT family two-component response regulator